ncbi:MAG: hypothetical protein NTZ33_04735 [Bacteroidetes bacterium]|nr:hypothetical protein [Bacteroidota bacterium]
MKTVIKKIVKTVPIKDSSFSYKNMGRSYDFIFCGFQNDHLKPWEQSSIYFVRSTQNEILVFKKKHKEDEIYFLDFYYQGKSVDNDFDHPAWAVFDKNAFYKIIIDFSDKLCLIFDHGNLELELSNAYDFIKMSKTALKIYGYSQDLIDIIHRAFNYDNCKINDDNLELENFMNEVL